MDSGLTITDNNNQNAGGVHAFYDEKKQEYGFLYPEITGYFLSALRFLHFLEPKDEIISRAKLSAS